MSFFNLLKVLHIIRTIDKRFGGVAQSMHLMVQAQSELGHYPEVLSVDDPKSSLIKEFQGVLYALGPSKNIYGYSNHILPWMRTHLNKYDVIVVHGLWQYSGFALLRTLKHTNALLYIYPHGMLDPWFKNAHPIKHIKKSIYWWINEYRLLAHADRVLFTTQEELCLARGTFWPYKAKGYVLGNGTWLNTLLITQKNNSFLDKFPFLKQHKILFNLGRIHPKKGLDLLVQAWKQLSDDLTLKNKFESWALVIAGPIDDQAYFSRLKLLSAHARAPIYFLPQLDDKLKYSAYQASEFFILPSHQENFGLVVAEALACGTPVLITNKVNLWKDVKKAQCAWIATDTYCGIKSLIIQALSIQVDQRLVDLAKYAALKYYDIYKIASKFINLAYKDLNKDSNFIFMK